MSKCTYPQLVDWLILYRDQIWGPLSEGTSIVIFPTCLLANPKLLTEIIEIYRCTRICLIPSVIRVLVHYVLHCEDSEKFCFCILAPFDCDKFFRCFAFQILLLNELKWVNSVMDWIVCAALTQLTSSRPVRWRMWDFWKMWIAASALIGETIYIC